MWSQSLYPLHFYSSSFQVGYDPVPILNNAMFRPRTLFSASEASRLKALAKPLIIHLVAAVFACGTLVAAASFTKIGTIAEVLAALFTCILTLVALGLDTVLFVPMKNAIFPYSESYDYQPLSRGYWLVVASAISIVCALTLSMHEHLFWRGYERNAVAYVNVEEATRNLKLPWSHEEINREV